MNSNKILVANIGSTSFKFRLFEMPSERLLAKGGVERIGSGSSPYQISINGQPPVSGTENFANYGQAISMVEKQLSGTAVRNFGEIAAFGFKTVMAKGISGTQLLDETVLKAMEEINTLFPAHNPPYVAAVRAMRNLYPQTPCIGTFETAFYDELPEVNRKFAIPLEWEEKYGIRRTGFHGASHRYVTQRAAEIKGTSQLNIISCHLGGSSSIAAVRNGKAINSSWGMTAQSGLPQNNRVGDFDVFALIYLIRDLGLGLEQVEKMLNSNSGLKGMSGLPTGDIRDLKEAAAKGHKNAQLAVDVYVSQIRKYIGQFLLELNGADMLIFTAGIAENNPDLRAAICSGMDFCGLKLDERVNENTCATEGIISDPTSKIEVMVIPTNEEIIIARNAWAKLKESGNN